MQGYRNEWKQEMVSARKIDWPTLVVLGAMYALLIGNFVLYRLAPLPLLIHILLAAAAVHLAFTVWHEGVHGNVSRHSWVNALVGMTGIFPYMTPYFMQRWIHLQHHAHLNEPGDPNLIYADGPFWQLPLRYVRAVGYVKNLFSDDPRARGERIADALSLCAVAGIYAAAWWEGMLFDVICLWLLPVVIAKVVMDWYINYLPHTGLPADRFRGTRIVDVSWFTPLVLCHNYHAVHHLWPPLPWHRYRGAFTGKLDYLRRNGVPIEHSVFQRRVRAAALAPEDHLAG